MARDSSTVATIAAVTDTESPTTQMLDTMPQTRDRLPMRYVAPYTSLASSDATITPRFRSRGSPDMSTVTNPLAPTGMLHASRRFIASPRPLSDPHRR